MAFFAILSSKLLREKDNLADKKSKLVKQLLAKMDAFDYELNNNRRTAGKVE